MERILPPLPFSSSAVLPRLDGLGRYNRAIRRELTAMGLDGLAVQFWARQIAYMAHGHELGLFGAIPHDVRAFLECDGSMYKLNDAGRAWLEKVKKQG